MLQSGIRIQDRRHTLDQPLLLWRRRPRLAGEAEDERGRRAARYFVPARLVVEGGSDRFAAGDADGRVFASEGISTGSDQAATVAGIPAARVMIVAVGDDGPRTRLKGNLDEPAKVAWASDG